MHVKRLEDIRKFLENKAVLAERTHEDWVAWIDKNLSDQGRDMAEAAAHLEQQCRKDLSADAHRKATEIHQLASLLNKKIGEIIIQVGKDYGAKL